MEIIIKVLTNCYNFGLHGLNLYHILNCYTLKKNIFNNQLICN